MHIEIITPDRKIYSGEISLIKVPGSNGFFEILNNHAPIISTLEEGKIKIITTEKEIKYFHLSGGLIEVKDNSIILLAESIEPAKA